MFRVLYSLISTWKSFSVLNTRRAWAEVCSNSENESSECGEGARWSDEEEGSLVIGEKWRRSLWGWVHVSGTKLTGEGATAELGNRGSRCYSWLKLRMPQTFTYRVWSWLSASEGPSGSVNLFINHPKPVTAQKISHGDAAFLEKGYLVIMKIKFWCLWRVNPQQNQLGFC